MRASGRPGRTRSRPTNQYVLANQILDIVRDRRLERGQRLAELSLSRRLGVSRTPVRAALRLLKSNGIVVSRHNQGFSLLKSWAELRSTMLAVPSTREDELHGELIRNRLADVIPNTVTQSLLLKHFGVSRAVLTRTLARMADEGLVVKNQGHGWTFLPSIDTTLALRNSYDFRMTVEPAVFLLASFRIDLIALDRVRSRHLWLLEQGENLKATGKELFEIDARFHETIASFGQNSFFEQAVQHQNRLRRLFEYEGYWNLRRIQSWVREHLEIIDALWAGDHELAAERMRNHIASAYRAAVKLGFARTAGYAGRERAADLASGPTAATEPPPAPCRPRAAMTRGGRGGHRQLGRS